jgi:hypothetical protein
MKKLLALSILLVCSIASAQGKYRMGQHPVNQNPADYTIKLHISATHFRSCAWTDSPGQCTREFYADAILDGKKLEIFGAVDEHQVSLIAPGDYLASLWKKPRDGGKPVLGQTYYLLLPDKSAWPCSITGFSE